MKRGMIFFFAITIFSCETIVDVDVPIETPKLTVNSLTDADSTWTVDVSKSKYILEPEYGFEYVNNAVVTITDEDLHNAFSLNFKENGRYVIDRMPVPGHKYSLNVKAEGFDDVTSTTTIPDVVKIKSAVWDSTDVTFDNLNFEPSIALYVTFDDPPGVHNNYFLALFAWYAFTFHDQDGNVIQRDTTLSYVQVYHNDPSLAGIKGDDGVLYHQFSDLPFDGQEKTIKLIVPSNLYFVYKATLRLGNQTGDYGGYEDTRWLQFQAQGDPFAQPASVYTNIRNGYGIFAGRSCSEVSWDVPKLND